MQEKIEQLKALFKQREEVDQKIADIIGIGGDIPGMPVTPVTPVKQKRKWTRKTAKIEIKGNPGKQYRCEDCEDIFFSHKSYLDVSCGACGSRKIIRMPE